MVMDRFENTVREVFDFNRFELQHEMQGLIADFEKNHPAATKGNAVREQVSFTELSDIDRKAVKTAAPEKQPGTERNKGKSK